MQLCSDLLEFTKNEISYLAYVLLLLSSIGGGVAASARLKSSPAWGRLSVSGRAAISRHTSDAGHIFLQVGIGIDRIVVHQPLADDDRRVKNQECPLRQRVAGGQCPFLGIIKRIGAPQKSSPSPPFFSERGEGLPHVLPAMISSRIIVNCQLSIVHLRRQGQCRGQ